jgi:hypothetical protein
MRGGDSETPKNPKLDLPCGKAMNKEGRVSGVFGCRITMSSICMYFNTPLETNMRGFETG